MRSDRLYLVDIFEACDAIACFLAGATTDAWVQDEVRQGAVMHKLIVIGEAAARLSNDFGPRMPSLTGLALSAFGI
jgi:uncharacterized protein with HEPN domain